MLPSASCLPFSVLLCVARSSLPLAGQGGKGGGGGAKSYDGGRAWSSIDYKSQQTKDHPRGPPADYPLQISQPITPTALQRKSHLCIPFLGIARPQPQFPHSCVCERFILTQQRSSYFLQQNRQTDGGNISIAHTRMNVEIGTDTPIFLFWEYLFLNFGILSLQCGHWVLERALYIIFATKDWKRPASSLVRAPFSWSGQKIPGTGLLQHSYWKSFPTSSLSHLSRFE
jgi:hypothetical protein